MEEEICLDLLIDEIEKRDAIWNLNSKQYSNKIIKRRSWEELVLIFCNHDDSEEKKKNLEKYPEIKQLYGSDPKFKWVVTAMVAVQLLSLPFVQHLSWPTLLLLAYCFGGVISHALMLAIHEIGHNLAFSHARPMANRLLGFFANLPLAIPGAVSFRKYHKEHHKHQAIDTLDPDLPTVFEGRLCSTTLGKLFWLALFPVFYLLRPFCVRPLPLEPLEVVNVIVQLVFDAYVVHLFGWKPLLYCIVSFLITMTGFHPLGGHFISEHYMLKEGVETCSYYGPLNALAFNFGYHMEHHDFPAVPASRLPEVKRIAAEFYEELPHHTSLCSVIYQFVMDPSIGPYARIKRKQRAVS